MEWTRLIAPGIVLLINGITLAYFFGKLNEKVKNNEAQSKAAIELVLEKHKEAVTLIVEKICEYEKADLESKKRLHDRIDNCEKDLKGIHGLRSEMRELSKGLHIMTGKIEALIEIMGKKA